MPKRQTPPDPPVIRGVQGDDELCARGPFGCGSRQDLPQSNHGVIRDGRKNGN